MDHDIAHSLYCFRINFCIMQLESDAKTSRDFLMSEIDAIQDIPFDRDRVRHLIDVLKRVRNVSNDLKSVVEELQNQYKEYSRPALDYIKENRIQ